MLKEQNEEIWAEIPGHEGSNSAYNYGRIKSNDHITSNGHRWKGRILKLSTISRKGHSGYQSVRLSIRGKQKTYWVHRLVMTAFYGIEPGKVIDHINNNPSDNRLENLRYCTQRDNAGFHKKRLGVTDIQRGKKRYRARIWVGKKSVCLGLHYTPDDAQKAYLKAKACL